MTGMYDFGYLCLLQYLKLERNNLKSFGKNVQLLSGIFVAWKPEYK